MMTAETGYKLRFGLRELFYVSLCVVLGYLLRVQDSYSLYPVWRKRSEMSKFANGKFMTDADRCPLPVVTDLEGDGVNEIVLISNDLQHLNVLAMPPPSEEGSKTLAHVVVKDKAELSLVERVKGHKSRPAVVGVGFTVPYTSMMQIRKQVIVVVTDDWQVLCYAHDLKLLWYQQLPLPVSDFSSVEVKALAVLVSPFSIEKKHKGLIVVSGSFRHKTHKPDLLAEFKRIEEPSRNRTIIFSSEYENETLTHFSTFALSAEDGLFLWKHTSGDFEKPKQEEKKSSSRSDIHWKLALCHKKAHKGESPWSDYGRQLDVFLPHMWADNSDTEIIMARINKQFDTDINEAQDSHETSTSQNPSALLPEHLIGFSYGGQRPHSDHEHVNNPNSLMVRSPEGMQVLSLVTGEPKTTLLFPPDRSVYLDMDGDGHLEKLVWDLGQHYSPCYVDVWRINPVQERLQQIALCYSKRIFWSRSWSLEEDVYKKIPPKVIKSVARKSGVLHHFLGHRLFEENTYDIITFGGLGRVSSIGIDGTIHWQTATEAKWADLSMNMRRAGGRPVPDEIKEEFLLSFQPSRVIMPLKEAGAKAAVAVSGWNTLAVVDLVEGTVLAQHSIPAPSTGPLVYGDFDNDGLMDIILTCKKGYIGFTMKLQHNYELTVLYTISVFLLIILISWLISASSQSESGSEKDDDDDNDEEEDEMDDDNIGTYPVN
ncbi:unnamed protein product [Candidula unifasciata]|uniref:FG-GAP repeat-containing protein n=1 Tax=Candidula unifasciata TaxID=100452 RepID=A0A8S3ZAQ1_9EUPU|nr:unnamed protein product [Candidula unifasciata]